MIEILNMFLLYVSTAFAVGIVVGIIGEKYGIHPWIAATLAVCITFIILRIYNHTGMS